MFENDLLLDDAPAMGMFLEYTTPTPLSLMH